MKISVLDDYHDTIRTLACFTKLSGHEIEIYPVKQKITDKETNTEKLVDMIRARAPESASAPSSPKATKSITAPTKKPPFDDGVPF